MRADSWPLIGQMVTLPASHWSAEARLCPRGRMITGSRGSSLGGNIGDNMSNIRGQKLESCLFYVKITFYFF